MGETDWHIHWSLHLRELRKFRLRDQRNYVASDLLLYYHDGVPRKFVVPDGFVVLGWDPKQPINEPEIWLAKMPRAKRNCSGCVMS